jgi:hypothetical protein
MLAGGYGPDQVWDSAYHVDKRIHSLPKYAYTNLDIVKTAQFVLQSINTVSINLDFELVNNFGWLIIQRRD